MSKFKVGDKVRVTGEEEWREIPGFEGLYEASNIGRIRSMERFYMLQHSKMNVKQTIRKTSINSAGYHRLQIGDKDRKVHRLVAFAFIPNPNNLPCINHKNSIRTDNRVENLEWCTITYNNEYCTKMGRRPRGEQHPNNKLSREDVLRVRELYNTGTNRHQISKLFNVSFTCIKRVINRTTFSYIP